jgi:GT2 family glycosyltransferase
MFSIIIVNWNGEKFIEKCLDGLSKQTYNKFKVYLVDNGSIDKSIDIAKSFQEKVNIQIIELDKNYGFAEANNIGIENALNDDNKFILTINNDIELDRHCLEKLYSTINENPSFDIFQVLMINYFKRDTIDAAGIKFNSRLYVEQSGYQDALANISTYSNRIQGACAGAAAYSKKALLDVKDKFGFFDKNFFAYYEDADLALRLLKKDYKTFLAKDSIVYHIHSGTSKQDSPFKTYYLTRNFLLCVFKNLDNKTYNRNKAFYYMSLAKKTARLILKFDTKGLQALCRAVKDYYKIRKNYKH